MARTFRRKNTIYNLDRVLSEVVRINPNSLWDERVSLDRHSTAGKKKLAVYHSDAGFGDYGHASAPHWYRRMRNKLANRREKQYLCRWIKSGTYLPDSEGGDQQFYELPKPVRVSDAGWYW